MIQFTQKKAFYPISLKLGTISCSMRKVMLPKGMFPSHELPEYTPNLGLPNNDIKSVHIERKKKISLTYQIFLSSLLVREHGPLRFSVIGLLFCCSSL